MKRWEDLGNDRWKLTILSDDPDDQVPPSVYRGTKDEIAEMLADSQGNANRRISELKRSGNGAAAHTQPVPLSAEQRLQTVAELSNPATVDKAITRVVESQMGGSMEELRERQHRAEKERDEQEQVDAALRFANSTPEWYQTDHNINAIVNFIVSQGFDLKNTSHYTLAFEKLSAAKLLQRKPSEAEPEPVPEEEDERERNAPVAAPVPRAPARLSTGVTQRDISGLPPRPTTRLKYTREQINDLSASDYKRLMFSDQEFSRCVEYYAQQDRQKRRVG